MDMSIFYSPLLGNQNQQLLQAVQNGDLKKIKELIAEGATVFCKKSEEVVDHRHYNALFLAIEQNRLDIVKELIKKQAARVIKQEIRYHSDFSTAIQLAVKLGHVKIVEVLINALQKASNDRAVLTYLDIKSKKGYTAFAIACQNGDLVMMDILAKAGAHTQDYSAKYQAGALIVNPAAPIITAMKNKHLEVIIALIQKYNNEDFVTYFKCANFNDIFHIHEARLWFISQGIVNSARLDDKKCLNYFVELFNDESKGINVAIFREMLVYLLKTKELGNKILPMIKLLAPYIYASVKYSENDKTMLFDFALSQNKPEVALELIRLGQSFWHLPCLESLKLILSETLNCSEMHDELSLFILAAIYASTKKNNDEFRFFLSRSLFKASELGVTHIVQYILNNLNIDPDLIDNYYHTPLLLAVEHGHVSTVRFLMSKRVNINRIHPTKNSPLMLAIANKHEAVAMHLMAQGADVRLFDSSGCTALIYAVHHNLKNIVNFILEKYPDTLKTTDFYGKNILMFAGMANHYEMIQLLAGKGINLNIKDAQGKTALIHSIECKSSSAVEQLINLGANLDHYHPDEAFILREGYRYEMHEAMKLFVLFLLQADPQILNNILKIVVEKNKALFIEPLVRLGANVNSLSTEGLNPLLVSASHQDLECFEILISLNANIKFYESINYKTLIQVAAECGNLPMIMRLEALSSEWPNHPACNISPIVFSAQKNQIHVVKYFLDKKTQSPEEITSLFDTALSFIYPEIVKLILEYNPDFKVKNRHGRTALCYIASLSGDDERNERISKITDILIEHGVELSQEGPALKAAIENNNDGMAFRLLDTMDKPKLRQFSKMSGMLQYPIQKMMNKINDYHILFINLFHNKFLDFNPEKEFFSFLHLPQDLKRKILGLVSFPVWYEHRLGAELCLARNKANSRPVIEAAEPVLFLAQTQMQQHRSKRQRHTSVEKEEEFFEANTRQPKKRRTDSN